MSQFVYVCDDEANRDGGVEIPAEEDGTVLLSVLQSQFEGASGLKYRNPSSGCWRAVKRVNDVLQPPEDGWGEVVYVVVLTPPPPTSSSSSSDGNKRKMEELGDDEERAAKNPRSSSPDFTSMKVQDLNKNDLIVLGLEWSVNDAELRRYFEQFGEVAEAEVKKERESGKSRGFGFVRFFDPAVQLKVQTMQHTIKSRRIDLKHPRKSPSYMPCKLFIGCLPIKPEATKDELLDYFADYGEVSDVYIPKPYRGFGFVTFQDGNIAQRVLSQPHRLRQSVLNITHADPKGALRGAGPPPPSANQYSYGYGSQFYAPQNAQGYYYGYTAAPQPAQYNFTRGFTPQTNYPRGAAPQPQPTAQQPPRVDQYQTNDTPPPPAKRPHSSSSASQYHTEAPPQEGHYQAYSAPNDGSNVYGGNPYAAGAAGGAGGGGGGRYREASGGWQPQQ